MPPVKRCSHVVILNIMKILLINEERPFFQQNQRAYNLALISAGIPLLPLVFDGFKARR